MLRLPLKYCQQRTFATPNAQTRFPQKEECSPARSTRAVVARPDTCQQLTSLGLPGQSGQAAHYTPFPARVVTCLLSLLPCTLSQETPAPQEQHKALFASNMFSITPSTEKPFKKIPPSAETFPWSPSTCTSMLSRQTPHLSLSGQRQWPLVTQHTSEVSLPTGPLPPSDGPGMAHPSGFSSILLGLAFLSCLTLCSSLAMRLSQPIFYLLHKNALMIHRDQTEN